MPTRRLCHCFCNQNCPFFYVEAGLASSDGCARTTRFWRGKNKYQPRGRPRISHKDSRIVHPSRSGRGRTPVESSDRPDARTAQLMLCLHLPLSSLRWSPCDGWVWAGNASAVLDETTKHQRADSDSRPDHSYALSAQNPRYFLSPLAMPAEFPPAERIRSSVSLNCCTAKSLFPRV